MREGIAELMVEVALVHVDALDAAVAVKDPRLEPRRAVVVVDTDVASEHVEALALCCVTRVEVEATLIHVFTDCLVGRVESKPSPLGAGSTFKAPIQIGTVAVSTLLSHTLIDVDAGFEGGVPLEARVTTPATVRAVCVFTVTMITADPGLGALVPVYTGDRVCIEHEARGARSAFHTARSIRVVTGAGGLHGTRRGTRVAPARDTLV